MLQYIIFSCSSYPSRDSVSSEPQWCSDHSQPNAQAAMYTTMQITWYVLNSLTLAHAHSHGNSTDSALKIIQIQSILIKVFWQDYQSWLYFIVALTMVLVKCRVPKSPARLECKTHRSQWRCVLSSFFMSLRGFLPCCQPVWCALKDLTVCAKQYVITRDIARDEATDKTLNSHGSVN